LSIARFEREEIRKWIEILKTEGGQGEMRYKQYQNTDSPTIQGVWTPFTHKALDKNITVFPKEEFAIPSHTKKSATEILSEMYTSSSNPSSRAATE
jgi:large subunit ribosomal protein L43